ncbi:hypothetical protein C8R45DRAFT_939758 [Mycena sanguinolenta]|nr:hypothetical protein C8R45DRAFT_939758 [Mycena sanguinolenta]
MCGTEHPAKVRWTQLFLPALGPLSLLAAQQMFKEIGEDYHKPEHIDQLLKFTDNMPLAGDLIANLVAYEGCLTVLAQLETEKTSLLSEGSDKRSNLDVSIALSITNHRLTACSILPGGLSDVELVQSNLVIPQIHAYNKRHLKSLVAIREYLQQFYPVAPATVQALQRHFQSLLDTYKKFRGSTQVTNILKDITLNLGNIHQVLSRALTPQNPDLPEIIRCTIFLDSCVYFTGLIHSIQAILPLRDHKLAVEFTIGTLLSSHHSKKIEDHALLASEAKAKCQTLNDPALKGRHYCWQQTNNWSKVSQKSHLEFCGLGPVTNRHMVVSWAVKPQHAINGVSSHYWRTVTPKSKYTWSKSIYSLIQHDSGGISARGGNAEVKCWRWWWEQETETWISGAPHFGELE